MHDVGHPTIASFKHTELGVRRVDAGLTQRAAAERLGVSTWTYRSWEAGQHTPRPERLPELAALLGCDPADLVDPPTTLAEYRTLAGYTQADLAEKLGVSRMTVAQWELGAMPIAPRHHQVLAELLDVPAAVLQDSP